MCGILCMYSVNQDIKEYVPKFKKMLELISCRGPDDHNVLVTQNAIFGHRRLSIIDLEGGKQPFTYRYQDVDYTITYNGEIYNMNELKRQLIDEGYHFNTQSDTEVVLVSYIAYKEDCVNKLDGIFAFAINHGDQLFVARDHLGVKPLYYYHKDDIFIASSEMKCILAYLQKAVVTSEGVKELLGLGPSSTPGKTIYKNIHSLRPAHYLKIDKGFSNIVRYWSLEKKEHNKSYEETVKEVRHLVNTSIQRQLLSDVPLCTMLSGGLDSSIITAVSGQYITNISTYSVDYQDQDKYFKAYDYQTTRDSHYINEMVERYKTNHQSVILSQEDLIFALKEALISRDAPGMADIDSSFLLFAKEIKKNHKVVLSGECADELFGGYPWFYKEELYSLQHFPWIRDIDKRINLFNDDIKSLNIKNYILDQYNQTLSEIDYEDTTFEDTNKRKMIYLNMEWFMQALLTRADSQTMRSSIELRVPFACKDIVQYMYNVPWKYMYEGGREKGLLRDAFKDFLPDDIYDRKKNPYPKTHSPIYTKLIKELLRDSFDDTENILYQLFNMDKLSTLIDSDGEEFDVPWFGQLMMGPQLLAYFYQIYLWGKIYKIKIELT